MDKIVSSSKEQLFKDENSSSSDVVNQLMNLPSLLDGPFIPKDKRDRGKPSSKPYAIGFKSRKTRLELAVDLQKKTGVKIWLSTDCGGVTDVNQFGIAKAWEPRAANGKKNSALKTVAPTLAADNPAYILEIHPTRLLDFVKWYCKDSTEFSLPSAVTQEIAESKSKVVISTSDQGILEEDTNKLTTDEREAVVKVRYGQGAFRDALIKIGGERCWMSGIEGKRLLIASHIRPWSHCGKDEESRGNIHNGLLLSALWDSAFDAGLITFGEDWKVVASLELSESAKNALGLNVHRSLPEQFRNERRAQYLSYHRSKVFEKWKN